MLSLLIRRELRASLRSPHTLLQPVLFFTLTICLFPLASGADNEALARIAPAALWIALLLAALLASEQLFAEDYADGTLSQDRIHLHELWQLLAAKLAAAWLRFTLPLLAVLPLLALMLHIPATKLPARAALLALGSLPLLLVGTPFQVRVWQALRAIPCGQTCSYQDIARAIGNVNATRAVAGAIRSNPLSVVVPCHRVIGKSGNLTGYNGGTGALYIKERLLALERATK